MSRVASFNVDGSQCREAEGSAMLRVRSTSSVLASHDAAGRGSSFVYIPSRGLSFAEAVMVSFTSGLGATLSVVAYAASLSGYAGFVFVLVIATATAIVEQQTLMRTSVDCNATTFEEMCQPLPAWARQTTIWSGVIYLWACGGFYFYFLEAFLEGQLCPLLCASNGQTWLCQSQWHLSLPIMIMVSLVCLPAELSGGLSRCINLTNTIVKTIVIIAAIAKGILTWSSTAGASHGYVAWNAVGFFRVSSILMGSLANSGIMPQLAADVKPNVRARATVWCPVFAVSLQSLVFLLVALSSYAALGSSVEMNIFRVYQEKSPDFLTTILQGGFAIMMYLGYPLVILPCKSQVWSFIAPTADGAGVPLSAASYSTQLAFTLVFALPCALIPLIVGEDRFGNFMLILSCTAGVWMNLLLPAMVLIYSKLLPSRRSGGAMDLPCLLSVGWILLLGSLCFVDGVIQIITPQHASRGGPLSQQCRLIFHQHHKQVNDTPA